MSPGPWQALAEAARALTELANALKGANPCNHSLSLSLPTPSGPPLKEVIVEFLNAKERIQISDRYLRQLRHSLLAFAHGRAFDAVDSISLRQVERYLARPNWKPVTRRSHCLDLRTFFNFAVRRGYLRVNPASGVELPRLPETAPSIHTPQQVETVLRTAQRTDSHVVRLLAIRYFGGLRTSEAERLAEEDIRLSQGVIEIKAAKAKTRRRRLVTIQPNLAAWLEQGGRLPLPGALHCPRFEHRRPGRRQRVLKAIPSAGLDDFLDNLPPPRPDHRAPLFPQAGLFHGVEQITAAQRWPIQAVRFIQHNFVALCRAGGPLAGALEHVDCWLVGDSQRVANDDHRMRAKIKVPSPNFPGSHVLDDALAAANSSASASLSGA